MKRMKVFEDLSEKNKVLESTILASSSSLEGIQRLIAKFWYDKPEDIILTPVDDKTWSISKKNGRQITDSQVVKVKGSRFQFRTV